jgi:pilus assembly protein CpaB
MREHGGPPPPLPARRRPLPIRLRILLWRSRFLVCAVCLGTAAASTVHALRPPDAPTVDVVVTARSVEAGVSLTGSDVRMARYPERSVPDGALTDLADAVGASTAVPLSSGSPLGPGLLTSDEVRGPAGTVVATVRFADPAVSGLLSAGMHVDVLAATAEGGPGGVVARRALVLPVARRSPDAGGLLGGHASDDDSVPVLVAVSPDEAPALAGAAASAVLSAVVVP